MGEPRLVVTVGVEWSEWKMAGAESRERNPDDGRRPLKIDPTLQANAAASVGGTVLVWWPAFTMGAYGAVFFDDLLGLWAVATAVLLMGGLLRTPGAVPRGGWIALSLPSLWIGLALVEPSEHKFRYLHYLEVVVTLLGAPVLAWLLSRILLPDYAELPGVHRLRAVIVTIVVGVLAFLLGKFNYLFLTCADFDVSGNNTPPHCAHGPAYHLP